MKFLILAFVLLMASPIFSQTPPIEPGVSRELARWRAAHYSDVRYKLSITLEKGAPLMKGDIEIRVNLTEEGAKNDLILDWRTTQFQNDKDKPYANVIGVNATGAQASLLAVSAKRENKTETSENLGAVSPSADDDASRMLALQSNEHLLIPKRFLKTGENVIRIEFASPIKPSGAAVTRYVDKEDGAEYVYTLFVPSDASTAFPVFDQPDLKARFTLTVNTPGDWECVSNENHQAWKEKDIYHFPGGKIPADKQRSTFHFKETKPISTYVFAFAAGEFAETDCRGEACPRPPTSNNANASGQGQAQPLQNTSDVSTKIYVRKSQAEKFKQHAAETFRLNREAVKYLESYFDYKFPFPKYDLVLIPEFPFGGMEHAGATFLRESSIIFPTEPTKNDFVSRANLIFHEAAHQWFGDLVTMRWFDDLWLKEGFAEFMAYKTLEKVLPEYNAWKIFYERNKQAAYLTDVTRGTTPIYQEIPNLSAAKSAYGNIVYRKAPSFLKQAEFYLGEKEFQTAVRAFLKKHEFANATWQDLVKEFETASGNDEGDLNGWGEAWVKSPGVSKIRMRIANYESKPTEKFLTTEFFSDEKEADKSVVKFKVLLINKDGKRSIKDYLYFNSSRKRIEPDTLSLNEIPIFIFPNYQDYGYGIFLLDERSRTYVLENIQTEKDDFLRAMMWGSLWDSVRFYELAPQDYVELVIKNLSVETDESTIQTLLGRVSTAMNYYIESVPPASAGGLTRADRSADTNSNASNAKLQPSTNADGTDLSARLENLLIEKMRNAPTLGLRITFYRAFLNVASSENARAILKDILSGKFAIEGFNCKGDACRRPQTSNKNDADGLGQAQPLQSLLKTKDKFDRRSQTLRLRCRSRFCRRRKQSEILERFYE
jgi:aminopeptidase N